VLFASHRRTFFPRMRERYGDVFTIRLVPSSRVCVVLSRPEHIREVFGSPPSVMHAGEGNTVLEPIMGSHSLLLLDDEDQLQAEDTLDDRGVADLLDEGYSPPEKWSAGEGFGTTADEALQGESLDQRIAQEVPDVDPYAEDGEDVGGPQVGTERSGRLVASDEGAHSDDDSELYAEDVGIDGAAAGAEEAAVHVVDDEDDFELEDDDDQDLESYRDVDLGDVGDLED